MLTLTWLLTTSITAFLIISLSQWFRRRQIMPPGPLGIPWFGNKYQVPGYKPWKKFEDWNLKYGPVASIMLGSTPTVIIGKAQYAWELLEKRSEIYSSRPRFIMASEILSGNRRGLMLSNTSDLWKHWRKMLHTSFHIRKAPIYHDIQSLESKILLKQLLSDPKNFDRHLKRFAASVVVAATYGKRINSVDEWIVKENIASVDYLTSINLPGKFLVESWPWLLHLPRFLQWFRHAPEHRKAQDELFLTHLLNGVKTRMKDGCAVDCLTVHALNLRDSARSASNTTSEPDSQNDNGKGNENGKGIGSLTDLDLAYAVSSPFSAGIDTTAGTLSVFILAMLQFPQVMHKAQQELDNVIGRDRIPEFGDKDVLPYVCAVINETLRWRPIPVLGGTAHASTADDEFHGKFIPKGSTVYANMYGIMRDPDLFPSPTLFLPDRFLPPPPNATSDDHNTHPRIKLGEFDLPFGFGRRICPGQHLALNSLFITISRILWGFEIRVSSRVGLPDVDAFTNQFNSKPLPFDCLFIPRSEKVIQLIDAEWENAQSSLATWQ